MKNKKKVLCALGVLIFFGACLLTFIIAADEQSVLSGGSPVPAKTSLSGLVAHGSGENKHVELTEFYFGKSYIYVTKLAQFNEVYVPIFPAERPKAQATCTRSSGFGTTAARTSRSFRRRKNSIASRRSSMGTRDPYRA